MKSRREAQDKLHWLANKTFISVSQAKALAHSMDGEEQQYFYDKVCEYADRIKSMPGPREQENAGDNALVYLHYFHANGWDWYITERDGLVEPQHQAFGLACGHEDEMGYISIAEIVDNGGELDLYWAIKSLHVVREMERSL